MSDVDAHRHCKVCGKVTRGTDETCSADCETKRLAAARSRQNTVYLFYGLIAVFAIFLIVQLG